MKKIITTVLSALLLSLCLFNVLAQDDTSKVYDFTAAYSEEASDMLGFKVKDGFNVAVINGKLSTVSTFGIPVSFVIEDSEASQYDYALFMLKSAYINENSLITMKYKLSGGEVLTQDYPIKSKDFALYCVKLPDEEIVSVEIFVNSVQPDGEMFGVDLDYLRFEKADNFMLLSIDKDIATVNGEEKKLDSPALIRNDFTLTPARFVAENAGAKVDWVASERKVVITKDKTIIELVIDSNIAKVNGQEIVMDVCPCIINDFTYTPARFVAENLGCDVNWEPSTRTVIIKG